MVSYRDPNLAKTNDIYEAMPDYISKIKLDERELTKYIIGTISDLDTPRSAHVKGSRGFNAWIAGVTDEMAAKERYEVLHCTEEDIRALAPIVQAVLDCGQICVLGSEEKITEAKELFNEVKPLFR